MQWYTTHSVAVIMGVAHNTVQGWCRAGKMSYVERQHGGKKHHLIPETAVVEFLEVYWKPSNPNAKPVTLDHLIEYGLKSGAIKTIQEVDFEEKQARVDRKRNRARKKAMREQSRRGTLKRPISEEVRKQRTQRIKKVQPIGTMIAKHDKWVRWMDSHGESVSPEERHKYDHLRSKEVLDKRNKAFYGSG